MELSNYFNNQKQSRIALLDVNSTPVSVCIYFEESNSFMFDSVDSLRIGAGDLEDLNENFDLLVEDTLTDFNKEGDDGESLELVDFNLFARNDEDSKAYQFVIDGKVVLELDKDTIKQVLQMISRINGYAI